MRLPFLYKVYLLGLFTCMTPKSQMFPKFNIHTPKFHKIDPVCPFMLMKNEYFAFYSHGILKPI